MPIVNALHFNVVWFGCITLINIQLGLITPPFGLDCYTLKALVPGVTVGEVFRSTIPFLGMGAFVIALIMVFPQIVLWLPTFMAR